MNRLLPCCLLLLIVAVWGWAFALMKEPVAVYGVVSFLAVRFVIGSAAIGGFFGPADNQLRHKVFAALFGYHLAGNRLTAPRIAGAALMVGALVIGQVHPLVHKAGGGFARRGGSSKDA